MEISAHAYTNAPHTHTHTRARARAHTERQRERAIDAQLHRKALESMERHTEEALLCEIILELLLVLLEGGGCVSGEGHWSGQLVPPMKLPCQLKS